MQQGAASGFQGDETARVRARTLARAVRRSQLRRCLAYLFLFPPLLILSLVVTLSLVVITMGGGWELAFFGMGIWEWIGKRFGLPDSHWHAAHAQLRHALPEARSAETLGELLVLLESLSREKHPEAKGLVRLLEEHLAQRLMALPSGDAQSLPASARVVLAEQVRRSLKKPLPVDFLLAALLTLAEFPEIDLTPVARQLALSPQSERIREAAEEYLKAVS
jgi:hypothetical protein